MLSGLFGQQKKRRKMTVAGEAIDYLIQEEENKLVDADQVTRLAVERALNRWASFSSMKSTRSRAARARHGPDVS